MQQTWSNTLKQGHLQEDAQDCAQETSGFLCGQRLHNLSGKHVPVLSHLHSKDIIPDI